MTPRLSRLWLLIAFTSSCFTTFAQTPANNPTAPSAPAGARPAGTSMEDESIGTPSFSDMPLELAIPLIEQWTGRIVLRPQALPQANITLVSKTPLTKGEAMRALETLLNLNQIALVRMGDKFIKIVALQNARGESPTLIEGSTLDLPPSNQIVSKLFQLQFLRITEAGQMLGGLLGNGAQPVVFDKNNSVLVTDTLANIQRIELLLQKLDQPMVSNIAPKFYTIKFAKASDLVNKIRAMLQTQPQIGTSTTYTPDDRTNQVILISDPRLQGFFDELIAKLDVKSDPNTRNEVLYLKHASAKDVAPILNQLVSGQTKAAQSTGSVQPGMVIQPTQPNVPNQPAAPINNPSISAAVGELGSTQFSSLVTIIADERSNAIVVNGTMDDIRLIKELVDKLDIVLAQVRIEVVITEVSLSDASSTGISALGLDVVGNKLIGISGTTSGMTVTNDGNSAGYYTARGQPNDTTPYQLASGLAATAGHYSLVGLISLSTTPRKSNSRIISDPTITTTHNKEAKFFFGETRPVVNGSTSTPVGTSSSPSSPYSTYSQVSQQEIGTTLTVKPLIGNDGSVQLDIKQTITDVTGTVKLDNNDQYIIGKRETDSFVTVKSGEIIVLAGIQKDNSTHSTSRLGPIPWIGDLLGGRSRNKTRTEMIIFIRPYVLTNTPADNEEAMKRIEAMPDPGAVKHKLDPKVEEPKTPIYKKLFQIP